MNDTDTPTPQAADSPTASSNTTTSVTAPISPDQQATPQTTPSPEAPGIESPSISAGATPKTALDLGTRAFFDDTKLTPSGGPKFVAWVDLMGTKERSKHLPRTVAINVGKLHDAAVRGCITAKSVTPIAMGDGAYLVSANWEPMAIALRETLRHMALAFVYNVFESEPKYAPLCRAGVARGSVVTGADLVPGWSHGQETLHENYHKVANGVILGAAAGAAYSAEALAAPFGVAIDPSAHGMDGERVPDGQWWRWLEKQKALCAVRSSLVMALTAYYDWAEKNEEDAAYARDARERHRAQCTRYFGP